MMVFLKFIWNCDVVVGECEYHIFIFKLVILTRNLIVFKHCLMECHSLNINSLIIILLMITWFWREYHIFLVYSCFKWTGRVKLIQLCKILPILKKPIKSRVDKTSISKKEKNMPPNFNMCNWSSLITLKTLKYIKICLKEQWIYQ